MELRRLRAKNLTKKMGGELEKNGMKGDGKEGVKQRSRETTGNGGAWLWREISSRATTDYNCDSAHSPGHFPAFLLRVLFGALGTRIVRVLGLGASGVPPSVSNSHFLRAGLH